MPFDYLWFRTIFNMNFSLVWKFQFPSILFTFHPTMISLTLMPIKKCFLLEGFNNLKRVLVYFLCVTIESMDPMQVVVVVVVVWSTWFFTSRLDAPVGRCGAKRTNFLSRKWIFSLIHFVGFLCVLELGNLRGPKLGSLREVRILPLVHFWKFCF